jgi:hypothetical protein
MLPKNYKDEQNRTCLHFCFLFCRGTYKYIYTFPQTFSRQWEKVEVMTLEEDEQGESEDEDEDGEGEGTRLSVNGLETQHRKNHIF